MNTHSLYDNNIGTIVTFQMFEHKQKYVRKSESHKNASRKKVKQKQHMNVGERKDKKESYKQQRSLKRLWED